MYTDRWQRLDLSHRGGGDGGGRGVRGHRGRHRGHHLLLLLGGRRSRPPWRRQGEGQEVLLVLQLGEEEAGELIS